MNRSKLKKYAHNVLMNPNFIDSIALLILFFEVAVNVFVIKRVKYTEIDWKAYMQEVEGFLNGTTDYSELKGDTGPLVYPAGFVYIFSILYFVTDAGKNVRAAQYVYFGLYLLTLYVLYRIYKFAAVVPPYALFITCCISYRIHSIYVLRLFNDPIAVLLLYTAVYHFLCDKWTTGSIIYSLAVSVKMNILLYSPALLLAYLYILGWWKTVKQLFICATVQFTLAAPFLVTNYKAYLIQSFNLARVFLFRWTVNWKFVAEHLFLNRTFHILLLLIHVMLLLIFNESWRTELRNYRQLKSGNKSKKPFIYRLLLLPLFTCNFIGIVCSRSLHYQFYVWYYHTLPFLLWHTNYSDKVRLTLLGVIELCWNTYPATSYSSASLFVCHLVILHGLFSNRNIFKFTVKNK